MEQNDNRREAAGIVLFFLALALILMFYLPTGITGIAGSAVRDLGFGLIGSAANLIPAFILYAAFDFFFEKRQGVARFRVRTVIMIIFAVSAFLAAITMDFDHFRTLAVNDSGNQTATAAISLLWQSGVDKSLILKTPDSFVLPGGVIGGVIALGLYTAVGKVLTCLTLALFFILQVVLVFRISLKKTAKKAVNSIGNAVSRKRPSQVKQYRPQQGATVYTGSDSRRYQEGTETRVNRAVEYSAQGAPARTHRKRPDPFQPAIPVDSRTGFIDVSDPAFGVEQQQEGRLNYENRVVDTTGDHPKADFEYTAMPKNAPLHKSPDLKRPSFLPEKKEEDFIDLTPVGSEAPFGGNVVDINDDMSPADGIYEVEDDGAFDNEYVASGRGNVRVPVMPGVDPAPARRVPAGKAEPSIPVNRNTDLKGFSQTEGRIIDGAGDKAGKSVGSSSYAKPAPVKRRKGAYAPSPTSLLPADSPKNAAKESNVQLQAKARRLEEALRSYGIDSKVVDITYGPSITRFELSIATGTKVSRVVNLAEDIQLAMAAVSVRIEAPIPGKSAIGIEIPNDKTSVVHLRSLLETPEFKKSTPLTVALGRDIPGRPIYCDLAKMPHLLIAGSTGSGKSVCINSILTSILCHASPKDVRMIMIDPKQVELAVYNGIPHLYMPVVTQPKEAAATLAWAVAEMNRRYNLFAESSVRDINGYNEYLALNGEEKLPLVLIVIDELADLMTVAAKEVEAHIARLAAMARAAGMHLVIATQRPSVDVITGVIKSNVPSRIAFAVSSGVDSRTILDSVGAEKLLGKGDMLYAPLSAPKPIRGQGAFLTDPEVEAITNYLKKNYGPDYDEAIIQSVANGTAGANTESSSGGDDSDGDDLFEKAVEVVIEYGSASVSILQRRLGVGYPRAARLIDVLERKHIIGPFEGSKPRKVLVTKTDWLEMQAKGED